MLPISSKVKSTAQVQAYGCLILILSFRVGVKNFTKAKKKIYVCLGFSYLPYFFALKNAYSNILMVILA